MSDDKNIHVKIVTPERVLFDGMVTEAVVDTRAGQVTILPNHIPLITVLRAGEALLRNGEEETPIVLSGGVMEVARTGITILADTAEHIKEVDFERAEKAVELAEQLMVDKKFDVKEYDTLQHNLAKNRARVRSFRKWRK